MTFTRLFSLLALGTLAAQQLACSSTDDAHGSLPGPTTGGSHAGGAGGSAALGGGAQPVGGAATTVKPQACTKSLDCSTSGALCQEGFCSCAPDKPDICEAAAGAACVSKSFDPNNCGTCGTTCDAGAVCNAGTCGPAPTELATATGCGMARLAIFGSNLYWTETASGKVRTMAVTGGAVTDVATGQLSPTQIAVDADAVYWTNQGDGSAASSRVMKRARPLTDGEPVALKTATELDTFPAIAVGASKLYYALHTDVHQISTDQTVTGDVIVGRSVNFGIPTAPVVYGEVETIAVSATRVIWGTPGTRNVVETHPLTPWIDVNDMTGYARLGKSVTTTSEVGIDAQYGYWSDGERFLRDTVDAQVALAEVVTLTPYSKLITTFALGDSAVYAAMEDGGIFEHSLLPADPSDDTTIVLPVLVARDQPNVTTIVLDSAHLYWATSDCHIRSTPRR